MRLNVASQIRQNENSFSDVEDKITASKHVDSHRSCLVFNYRLNLVYSLCIPVCLS